MINLNQTAGTNDETIWVIKLRGEGNNLLTNGNFASSSGWTANGGWAISGGVATYTEPGIPPLDNSLHRTITAVENVQYVLEYEIISCSDSTIEMNVEGGGDNILSIAVKMDNTVGKHSINLLGVATKTKFTISFSSISAGESIVIDNIRLRKYDNIIYLSTRDISLDNSYSGQLLNEKNYISEVPFNSNILEGGGAGSVTSFNFAISRYVDNASLDGFMNEFYPSSDGGYIVSRVVDFGICWEGATVDTDITWLFRGRIIDYNYQQRQLTFVVFQESELTNKEVPYYAIQKDFNNGVSYYQYAPTENYGVPIPIVYGSFNIDAFDYDLKKVSPCICTDKRYLIFAQAAHKLYTQNSPTYTNALYKYISGADTYMVLIPDNGSSINYNTKAYVRLYSPSRVGSEGIKGKLFLVPKLIGITSDYNDIENILDNSNSTNITVEDTKELSVRLGEASTSDTGILSQTAADIKIAVSWQSDDGGNRRITLKYYNQEGTSYSSSTNATTTNTGGTWDYDYHEFGDSVIGKSNADLPYTIEEICSYDYVMANTSSIGATSGDLKIRQMYVEISNIIVMGIPANKNNVRPLRAGGEI